MQTRYTVDEVVLAEATKRIVSVAHLWKIILFGSAARGTMRAHSAIDLMVVKEGEPTLWGRADHQRRAA